MIFQSDIELMASTINNCFSINSQLLSWDRASEFHLVKVIIPSKYVASKQVVKHELEQQQSSISTVFL